MCAYGTYVYAYLMAVNKIRGQVGEVGFLLPFLCVFWESVLGHHACIIRLETAVHAELSQRYICLRKSCVHGVDRKLPLVALSKLLNLDLQQYHLFFTPSSLNVDTISLGRI